MMALLSAADPGAAELDPAAVVFKLPDQINWKENATAGNANTVLYGDPSKPGLYIVLVKWHAGHMSHPHFHPSDRFITVISGTWWVGTGTKFDPEATVPMPAGSLVTHFGKQVHYDGAKEGDTVLENRRRRSRHFDPYRPEIGVTPKQLRHRHHPGARRAHCP